jgi:hypothetical protein
VPAEAAVTDSLPLGFFEPLQAPVAVHVEALVDDHVSVEVPPTAIDCVLAEIVTVGAGIGRGVFSVPPPQAASVAAKNKTGKMILVDMLILLL